MSPKQTNFSGEKNPTIYESMSQRMKVSLSGTGKLNINKAYKRHILTKKTAKLKRNLRKPAMVDASNVKNMKKVLPYL